MGAIQGSVNSAIGSIAGALVAGKHMKETEQNKVLTAESQALVAEGEAQRATQASTEEINKWQSEELPTTEVDASGAPVKKTKALQMAEAKTTLDKANSDYNAAKKSGDPIARANALTARRAAKKAFTVLNDEYQAIVERADRASTMRIHAAEVSGRASELRTKYEKRWTLGGNK